MESKLHHHQPGASRATTAPASYALHTPERHPAESKAQYRARRALSKAVGRHVADHGLNRGTSSREQLRDSMRRNGTMGLRTTASDALMAAWAAKRVPKWNGPREEHGAYTTVGSVYELEGDGVEPSTREHVLGGGVGGGLPPSYTLRRKWLAGISAQRGF
jgi:hypothetical protein